MGSNPLPMAIAVRSDHSNQRTGAMIATHRYGKLAPKVRCMPNQLTEADHDADEQPPQGENPGAPPEGAFLRVDQVENRAPAEVAKVLEHDVARDKEPEHRRWVHLGRSYWVGPRPGFSAISSTASFAVLRPVP